MTYDAAAPKSGRVMSRGGECALRPRLLAGLIRRFTSLRVALSDSGQIIADAHLFKHQPALLHNAAAINATFLKIASRRCFVVDGFVARQMTTFSRPGRLRPPLRRGQHRYRRITARLHFDSTARPYPSCRFASSYRHGDRWPLAPHAHVNGRCRCAVIHRLMAGGAICIELCRPAELRWWLTTTGVSSAGQPLHNDACARSGPTGDRQAILMPALHFLMPW